MKMCIVIFVKHIINFLNHKNNIRVKIAVNKVIFTQLTNVCKYIQRYAPKIKNVTFAVKYTTHQDLVKIK
jgi:hypothetical protein